MTTYTTQCPHCKASPAKPYLRMPFKVEFNFAVDTTDGEAYLDTWDVLGLPDVDNNMLVKCPICVGEAPLHSFVLPVLTEDEAKDVVRQELRKRPEVLIALGLQ